MPMERLSFAVWLLTLFTAGVPTDKETHLTGIYDLVAVLTHKGRSADSGHYVAWVKQESGQYSRINYLIVTIEDKCKFWFLVTGKWIEFDDDNPIPQREEDITKLSGGGKITSTDLKCTLNSWQESQLMWMETSYATFLKFYQILYGYHYSFRLSFFILFLFLFTLNS